MRALALVAVSTILILCMASCTGMQQLSNGTCTVNFSNPPPQGSALCSNGSSSAPNPPTSTATACYTGTLVTSCIGSGGGGSTPTPNPPTSTATVCYTGTLVTSCIGNVGGGNSTPTPPGGSGGSLSGAYSDAIYQTGLQANPTFLCTAQATVTQTGNQIEILLPGCGIKVAPRDFTGTVNGITLALSYTYPGSTNIIACPAPCTVTAVGTITTSPSPYLIQLTWALSGGALNQGIDLIGTGPFPGPSP